MGSNRGAEVMISGVEDAECSETTIEIKIKTLDSQTYTLRVNKRIVESAAANLQTTMSAEEEKEEATAYHKLDLLRTVNTQDSSSLILRLQQTLTTCSKIIETGDFSKSEGAVATLVEFLDSISDAAAVSDADNEDSKRDALEILEELHQFIRSPSSDQAVLDALSFVLPKTVMKFAGISDKCGEIVGRVIDDIIITCSPRDMLTILCEALGSSCKTFKAPAYFIPLFRGLSKVFCSIQRRHFEQIKVAVPVILNVLKALSAESDDNYPVKDLVLEAIGIATSIQEVCHKLEGQRKVEVRALLGLFVLEIMALSSNPADGVSSCIPLVLQLSNFLSYVGFSYLGLITGSDVVKITSTVLGGINTEDGDDFIHSFPLVRHGATIAVLWAHMSDEVANASKEDLALLKDKLQSSRIKRWEAVGMFRFVLSSMDQSWELKKHAIDFLVCILDGNIAQKYEDENADCSFYITSLFATLQAIEKVIIYAPSAVLRKNAFSVFKMVLADIPTSQRFDILKALITNNELSSMVAILIDIVRGEIVMENNQRAIEVDNASPTSPFWSSSVLELVEMVLRPSRGGPPSLPEHSDAVLSALNLYRFLLITESTGKTNYTGVLSKNILQKVYANWLLPLRTLVLGIIAENKKDNTEITLDIICGLNPIEMVLYRCIELVEEKLK